MDAPPPLPSACDVLVVGAGIVGLAHAAEAAERGLSVIVVERDSRSIGASIRNFGHCCVTAQSGDLLELALVARERWLHFASLAGFFVVESGALAVARNKTELAIVEQLSKSRPIGQVVMLSAEEIRDELGCPVDAGADEDSGSSILGGAFLRDDLRVDPREAVASLANWLSAQPNVEVRWSTSYLGHEHNDESLASQVGEGTGAARTSRGLIRAKRTFVCAGHDLDYLFPSLASEYEIQRCALQMMRVSPPTGAAIRPAILTGTSMLRYPAFAETAAGRELCEELAVKLSEEDPALIAIGANVMFTQRPDGTLLVGDSHHYGATVDPFFSDSTSEILLERISSVLGVHELEILERWQGIYASSTKQPYLVAEPEPGVTVVCVTSGVGMTISFGLARRVCESLEIPS